MESIIFASQTPKDNHHLMDQPKIKRLLRCIALLSGNRLYSVDEIAEKLETSQRTVYRYIDTFREAGFTIVKVDDYKFRMVSIGDSLDDLSNIVCFSDEEAFIVNRLIDSLAQDNALKAGLRRKLSAVYDATHIAQYVDNKCTAKTVEVVRDAIQEKRVVLFKDYVSSYAGQTRTFRVEPFKFTTNFADVWAYDLDSGRNKRFKTLRIGEAVLTGEAWTMAHAHHDEPMDAFRCHGGENHHVVLLLNNAAKNVMVEEFPLTEPHVRQVEDREIGGEKDQAWIYDDICHNLWGVGRFVLGQPLNCVVLECDALKEFVCGRAQYILETYEK